MVNDIAHRDIKAECFVFEDWTYMFVLEGPLLPAIILSISLISLDAATELHVKINAISFVWSDKYLLKNKTLQLLRINDFHGEKA